MNKFPFSRAMTLLVCGILLAGCAGMHKAQDAKDEGLKLARLLRDQGRLEAATEVYARLDSRGSLTGKELIEYGSVASPVKPPQETLSIYSRARQQLSAENQTMEKNESLALCLGMARAQIALGRTQLAQRDLNCALAIDANNTSALNGYGIVLDASGKHSEARVQFEKALQNDPSDVSALNNMALSWLNSAQPERAIALLRTTDASTPGTQLNLALAYLYQGDSEAARRTLAAIASPDRVDGLMTTLAARVTDLKQPQGQNSLLTASRTPLQLSDAKQ